MKAYLQLVRAPAALTVLGDTVAGAAAAGNPLRGRRLLLPLSSAAFYWAGMALNDWADRELDAAERPERPIPSGRISPNHALAAAGGRNTMKVAVPLAAAVWAYDTVLKKTAAGPLGMAACRTLDVLLGAGAERARRALPSAVAVGGHTFGVTALSRGEVHGSSPATAGAVLAGTAATALTAMTGARSWRDRLGAVAFTGLYSGMVGRAQYDARQDPSAKTVRTATMAGIHGMVPLQAALAARRGSLLGAAVVAAALPVARKLSRKVSPT
jgi:4-hydroxybenzoate polyprenyltransferase